MMKTKGVKERIITTASKLFYYDGYNQTGINKILKEAEVSKDSMYRYFTSKEDIAVVYLQQRHIMWMNGLNEFVKSQKTNRDKVITSFDYLKDWLEAVAYRGCGFQNIIGDIPKEQNKIHEQVAVHKNGLRMWIHELLKTENGYDTKKAEELGDEILVLIEGAIILSQIEKESWPICTAKKVGERLLPKQN